MKAIAPVLLSFIFIHCSSRPAPQSPPPTPAQTATSPEATSPESAHAAAAQRVNDWKKTLPANSQVLEDTEVGAFLYVLTSDGEPPPTLRDILATPRGSIQQMASDALVDDTEYQAGIIDIGDIDGDGRTDIVLEKSGPDGSGAAVLYLDGDAGPTEVWRRDGPMACSETTYQGKPALHAKIIDTSGEEPSGYYGAAVYFWNGTEMAEAPDAAGSP